MSQQPEKSVAQVLREAADLLKRTGWTQRRYQRNDCAGNERFCMLGAINRVTNADTSRRANSGARAAVMSALGGMSIVRFNDVIAKRRAEVVAKLLEAADLAEQEATHV